MLSNFFGDDEHTAADGPYSRVMKARKWLYLSAGVATLYNLNLLKLPALEKIIPFIALPDNVVRHSLQISLAYLVITYIPLIIQVITTYDLIIIDRLRYRKDDDIRLLQSRVDESRREVMRQDKLKEDTKSAMGVGVPNVYSEPEHDAANRIFERHVRELKEVLERDPSDRPLYKKMEYFIDWSRIVLPLLVSLQASVFLFM